MSIYVFMLTIATSTYTIDVVVIVGHRHNGPLLSTRDDDDNGTSCRLLYTLNRSTQQCKSSTDKRWFTMQLHTV